jgi:glycosyltransferase involved in cell wall biosynthesis
MSEKIRLFCCGPLDKANEDYSQILSPAINNSQHCEFIPLEELPGWFFNRPERNKEWLKVKIDAVIICRINDEVARKCVDWFLKYKPQVKILCIDYYDGDHLHPASLSDITAPDNKNIFYFKRNMYSLKWGGYPDKIINYEDQNVAHSPFCVREDVLKSQNKIGDLDRDIDFSCFFEPHLPRNQELSKDILNDVRELGVLNVAKKIWSKECPIPLLRKGSFAQYASRKMCPYVLKILDHKNCHIGKTAKNCQEEGRQGTNIQLKGSPIDRYIRLMARSKIVVTACPSTYEGDFRLMEAMTSGAMVMHNKLGLPPEGLEDGKHWVVYEDAADMLEKLLFYLNNIDLTNEIGKAGRNLVIEKHRAHHRIEEWLKHIKLL